jgi:Holliday junction resolvase RusA-like endonuclease
VARKHAPTKIIRPPCVVIPAQPTPHVVVLPKPPSVNSMFRNAGYGRDTKRAGRIPSKQYNTWKAEAGRALLASKPHRIAGAYSLRIEIGRRKGSDLDNYAKGVNDLLVRLRVVQDDSRCELLVLEWADDLPSKMCRVSFAPMREPTLAR